MERMETKFHPPISKPHMYSTGLLTVNGRLYLGRSSANEKKNNNKINGKQPMGTVVEVQSSEFGLK